MGKLEIGPIPKYIDDFNYFYVKILDSWDNRIRNTQA